jgi:hypothetical protein
VALDIKLVSLICSALLKHAVKMECLVKFSAVASKAHTAYARLVTGQLTIKGWHAAVNQLITSNGFGTTAIELGPWWWSVVKMFIKSTRKGLNIS